VALKGRSFTVGASGLFIRSGLCGGAGAEQKRQGQKKAERLKPPIRPAILSQR
jgi:hypothetical protein